MPVCRGLSASPPPELSRWVPRRWTGARRGVASARRRWMLDSADDTLLEQPAGPKASPSESAGDVAQGDLTAFTPRRIAQTGAIVLVLIVAIYFFLPRL